MKRSIVTLTAVIILAMPATVLGHDPSKHKGKSVDGEVVSVGRDRFDLKTKSGTVPVSFSSKTKFEHGEATVDKSHLSKGQKVKVFGTKLPSGDLVAKEVLLGASSDDHHKTGKGTKSTSEHKR